GIQTITRVAIGIEIATRVADDPAVRIQYRIAARIFRWLKCRSAGDGQRWSRLQDRDGSDLPSAEQLADGAQGIRLRQLVHDARDEFLPDVEIGPPAFQRQVERVEDIHPPAEAAGSIDRFADGITHLKIQTSAEALLNACRRAVVGRTTVRLRVTDD